MPGVRGALFGSRAALVTACVFVCAATAQAPADRTALADSAQRLFQEGLSARREGSRASLEHALEVWRRAQQLFDRLGDRRSLGKVLNRIGQVHSALSEPDSGLAYYRQSLAVARAGGDRDAEETALHNVASAYSDAGTPDSALAYYRQALGIERAIGDRAGQGTTLNGIALVYAGLGQSDSALTSYRLALEIAREVHDRVGEGTTLNNIGSVYSDLGRPDSALAYYRQALAIRREAGDRRGEEATLDNIGGVYDDLVRRDSALFFYRQALAIEGDLGDRDGAARTLNNIGLVQDELGRKEAALGSYRAALAITREVKDRATEGTTLGNIGNVYDDLGQQDSALAYDRQSLAVARDVGDQAGEARVLGNIGVSYRTSARPDLRRAVAYYDSAAALNAGLAVHAGGEGNRLSFAEQGVGLFNSWVLAWLARGEEVGRERAALAALAAAERGRAQALLALMRRTRTDIEPGSDLSVEGRRLVAGAQPTSGAGRSGRATLAYLATRDTLLIWLGLPSGAVELTRRAVSRDSLADLVALLRAGLGADAAAADERVAQRGGPPLEAPAGHRLRAAAAASAGQSRPAQFAAAAAALAGLLVPPDLGHRLEAAAELVIVPDGVLALLPFAALPANDGVPLGIRYALRYAPSLATLAEAEQRPGWLAGDSARAAALRSALVVGNPTMPTVATFDGTRSRLAQLPGAQAEAEGVAARLGVRAVAGEEATEVAVRRRLRGAAVVHLATHGWAYSAEARARDSFVALAPGEGEDGLLTVGELLDDGALHLTADLVVLSACQTGLGDLKQAEGTVGLQRAFLAKGARSILVSLWSVSDQATAALMPRFYGHWLDDQDRPSKAEALRRAQDEVRRLPGFAEPRYWAAFQLVGAR